MGRIKHFIAVPALIGALAAGNLAQAGPQGELPPGAGRDLVEKTCTACHTQAIILQNRMTRDQWNQTITWMQEKQGLWELKPEERRRILDYLSAHLGPQADPSSGARAPARRKMYQYDYKANPL